MATPSASRVRPRTGGNVKGTPLITREGRTKGREQEGKKDTRRAGGTKKSGKKARGGRQGGEKSRATEGRFFEGAGRGRGGD